MTDVGTFQRCSYERSLERFGNVRRNVPETEQRQSRDRESVLTSLDELALGLWSFVLGEIDHHLKSLTREPMMIGATR